MSASYDRVLDPEVERVLSAGGELRFLIVDTPRLTKDPFALDIQIREGNTLMYYHGTTRLLTLTFSRKAKTFPLAVKANAAKAYKECPKCGKQYKALMGGDWPAANSSEFKEAWHAYLKAALKGANRRYYSNQKEGYWQNRLCIEFGTCWKSDLDWLVIDRECVIKFGPGGTTVKAAYYKKAQKKSMDIRRQFQESASDKWGKPDEKGFGDEVDMLAIDKDGKLLVIELKHGSNARGIYWGPLQVEVYYRAFINAPSTVIEGIRKLARQKIHLGLLPKAAEQRTTQASLILGDPVLAIAKPNKKSACWKQMVEVCEKTKEMQDWRLNIALLQSENDAINVHICDPIERALR